LIQYINVDDFCSKYIHLISENKKSKILENKKTYKEDNVITIYYFDYLFPYMEDIFSYMIYDLILNTPKFIFNY